MSQMRDLHPTDEILSVGTPDLHPTDEILSVGTPDLHPTDEILSVGTPDLGYPALCLKRARLSSRPYRSDSLVAILKASR
jgi:hypothetical protein